MIYSVDASAPPNPSILLALRLAQDHNKRIEEDMLNKLSQDAVQRAVASFSSGQVALNILAQQASCSDPRRVSANGSTINLVHLLEQKFQAELQNIAIHGNPLTNFYQLSLDVLALCQLNGHLSPANASALLSPDHKKYYLGSQFSVDTAAVAVLAQICLQTRGRPLPRKVHKKIRQNVQWLVDTILAERRDGVIGNIYSTGLAMQALSVSSSYLKPGVWSCLQTLHRVLDEIPQGTFKNPMAASQILPSLENRTYLDVSRLNCSMDPAVPADQQSLVTELQRRMESSVVLQSPPNPSILIALNLAGTQDGMKEKLLVQQIKDRVIKEGTTEMTSGEVALYVLALLSSCENPKRVTANINLVEVLNEWGTVGRCCPEGLAARRSPSVPMVGDHGTPKTTFYQLSLDTLALCLEGANVDEAALSLAREALAKDFFVGKSCS
ncbi:low density lipoprotein receptor adapter protein 1-like [Platysternon megacephalum]|uniref:Low density lipoprotein receptor adapter protein 1-like n=1 Tax=Platysternon megacephalum TaxID=55544 RepID=A0A4D9DXE2_9SAUR|nr:low density lipoprotein receptor adapter protein 1-like [Platysternon megacephalum]